MFERLAIRDVFTFTPKRHNDARGYFSETFNRALLEPMTGALDWVQDNLSFSAPKCVVRGLHFQIAPFEQDKLIRCLRGSVLDVAVDIRRGSPTFGRNVSARLSAENGVQLFAPRGFAHGFVTLEPAVEIVYKVTNYYNAACDRGLAWNDPALGIDWGIDPAQAILSEKDLKLPKLADLPDYFVYP